MPKKKLYTFAIHTSQHSNQKLQKSMSLPSQRENEICSKFIIETYENKRKPVHKKSIRNAGKELKMNEILKINVSTKMNRNMEIPHYTYQTVQTHSDRVELRFLPL